VLVGIERLVQLGVESRGYVGGLRWTTVPVCIPSLSLAIYCVAFRSRTPELTNRKSLERTWGDRELGCSARFLCLIP
jgi:hypothetical protein